MSESATSPSWVDRYVRDQLTTAEMAEFEIALLDSPTLAEELETALAIRETLVLGSEERAASNEILLEPLSGSGNWQPITLAATVVLAGFSTLMFWKTSNEATDLQRRVDLLSQPRTGILTVPVNIMRSSASQTPDVVIKIPDGHSAVLLDIELSAEARKLDTLDFAFRDPEGEVVAIWTTTPSPKGYTQVLLGSEQVPAVPLWLEVSSEAGILIERRLIEFR